MIVSIVGAYDREAIQTFVNALLQKGGVTEIRLLQMGTTEYITSLSAELKLVHDFEKVMVVDLKDLVFRNGVSPDVLVFMNSSVKPISEFVTTASHLLKFIAEEIQLAAVAEMRFLFGDNYRGVAQQKIMRQHLLDSKLDLKGFKLTTVSSIYEISKILNSTESDEHFRCYPKTDGTGFVYDPSDKMTADNIQALTEDLTDKLESIETMFSNRSASSYPNIEGTVLSRFMVLFIQNKDWELAMRDCELISRHPSEDEIELYGLDSDEAIFLPPLDNQDDEEDSEEDGEEDSGVMRSLPKCVFKHIKDASDFVKHLVV